ncbi:MAG: DNA polymerase III subunit gamma/tau [Patescibacteria group bacterium]|nr:DNA polymerase III subunit gamma/tau [Patescibacteria group bacterium]
MFYHTYRPRTIAELDNTAVRESLGKILSSNKLPQAYLFVGQKGMGKTSTARIFAKAVNCLENSFAGKGHSPEPCNACENCRAIETGTSPDVTEQDAGARGLKEEMLDLIREASYAPITGRYRVYILDEAHMISKPAFNALLKTLEEPPKHVLFIFATTNEEKVPATIVSRCVRVNFGKAMVPDIRSMLNRITTAERVDLDPAILDFIADNADYSFRDATKMLEETIMQKITTLEEVQRYFGLRSRHLFLKTLEQKSPEPGLRWIRQFIAAGGNSKLLIEECLNSLQEALLAKSGVPVESAPETTLSIKEIALAMRLFTDAYGMLRNAPIEAIPLEIALVEFYNGKKL